MEQQYLSVLRESLEKKLALLNSLLQKNEEQAEILKADDFSMDNFDRNTNEKAVFIKELLKLDEGFQLVYNHLKEYLADKANQAKHADEIKQLQKMIGESTEKSMSLEASEARNKKLVEQVFKGERERIRAGKANSKVALDYYKSMNQVNYIDPQFVDRKK